MKKITQIISEMNAKISLASLLFFAFALQASHAQTTTIELDIPPSGGNGVVGVIRTMASAETAHPAGGTFTVSFDVDPGPERRVSQGGDVIAVWAAGTKSRYFFGTNNDVTSNVSNLQVNIIDDNGGTLKTSDFSNLKFVAASIGNAKHADDAGAFTFNGEATQFPFAGTTEHEEDPVAFPFPSSKTITSFNVGVTSDASLNKWGIAGMTVSVTYNDVLSTKDLKFEDAGYKLYPNPATNSISVESEAGATITIYSITGATILQLNNAAAVQQIDTNTLARGVYLVRVNDVVSKLIIE